MSVNLILGDCLEEMNKMTAGSVDMILTDPPYEISNSGGGMMGKDGRNFIEQIDCMGMCKDGFDVSGFLVETLKLFRNRNHYNGVFFLSLKQLHLYLKFAIDNKLQYGLTYWHKSDPAPLCNFKYLNDVELCIYIKGASSKILGSYASKSLVYSSGTNRKDKKTFGHPTVKPVQLMEKYLINHTEPGAIVFDPFMGSGTTGVAC
ncbi:site-specific DNA-methyltransferase, partial [Candidatus Dependentiae bacterium]